MVAESIVIFAPIFQVGCASASAAVTRASASAGVVRNGPPDAVRINRRTSPRSPARSAWWSALCSESIGRMATPRRAAAAITSSPAITSVSLLARRISRPAAIACQVGTSPIAPTRAPTTASASGWVAAAMRPASPLITSRPGNSAASRRASVSSATATSPGRCVRTCSPSSATLRPAARATTANRSGKRAATSSVAVPIEPVEPRTASRFTVTPRGRAGGRARTGRRRTTSRCGRESRRGLESTPTSP